MKSLIIILTLLFVNISCAEKKKCPGAGSDPHHPKWAAPGVLRYKRLAPETLPTPGGR